MHEKKFHPAWLMLIACCFIQIGSIGTISNAAGILIPAVLGDLGFSQGSFTLYMTLQGLCAVVGMPIAGKLLNKVNIRLLVSVGMIFTAGPFMLMSRFTEVWQWYIAGSVLGFASSFVFTLPTVLVISNWFKKKTGQAMGIAMACAGIGGAIMNPLGNFFIQQFGWRMTYFLMGAIALVLVLPFTLLLVRAKPADMGTLAYGEEAGESQESAAQQVLTGVPAKVALRSLSFVCIFLVAGCIAFCTAFIQLVPTFAGTVGLSAIAAFMASAVMIGNIAGKLVLGWLNDKLGPKRAALLGIAAVCASFLLLFLTALGPAAALVGAFLLGISMSLIAVSMPLIVRSAYGSRDYSQIFSIVTMAPSLVGSLGMAAIGFMYDAFGSYNPVLVVGIVCCGLAGLLLIVGLASAGRLSAQVEKTA